MIYEFVKRTLDDLEGGWRRLKQSLERLKAAVPAASGATLAVVNGFAARCGAAETDVQNLKKSAKYVGYPMNGKDLVDNLHNDLDAHQVLFTNLNEDLTEDDLLDLIGTAEAADARREVDARLDDLELLIPRKVNALAVMRSEEVARGATADIRDSVNDFNTFPILTEEVGSGYARGRASPAAPAGGLGLVVEAAFRDVLGWRPNLQDPKGLRAALEAAFTTREVEGRTEYVHRRPTYSAVADMGAVTGAQASIASRARAIRAEVEPLLLALKPLEPHANDDDVRAVADVIRSALAGMVEELGVTGGPRVQRVDTFLATLLGTDATVKPARSVTADNVGGHLGQIKDLLGLERDKVNTIDEERNLTNFVTLVDAVNSLRLSWLDQRGYFDRTGTDVFFGTQMVLVSRALAAVVESVDEVEFAMDSVFMGAAERQTAELFYTDGPPLFVAELLDWVRRFASTEAGPTIRMSGKLGVTALLPTLERLVGLVRGALAPDQAGSRLPVGFTRPRVQRAILELADHLLRTLNLAQQISPEVALGEVAPRRIVVVHKKA